MNVPDIMKICLYLYIFVLFFNMIFYEDLQDIDTRKIRYKISITIEKQKHTINNNKNPNLQLILMLYLPQVLRF